MKHLKALSFALIALITIAASCHKNEYPEPGPDDFYFRCKIDGRLYIPNSCANCSTPKLLGDTNLLLNGNAGFESILIAIINFKNEPLKIGLYNLNNNSQRMGSYDNSSLVIDIYETNSTHLGLLNITTLDKTKRIIQGTFYFKAYNAYRNDSVNVTDGKFRLKYTTN